MNWPRLTTWVILAAILLLGVYDVVAVVNGGVSATISYEVMQAGYHWPAIAFAAGFLCGHWFWRIGLPKE